MAPPTPTPEKKKRLVTAINKYMTEQARKNLTKQLNFHFKNLNLSRRANELNR